MLYEWQYYRSKGNEMQLRANYGKFVFLKPLQNVTKTKKE
jgi:hypothetical protein